MVAPRSAARSLGRLLPSTPAGEVGGRLRHNVGEVNDYDEGTFRIYDVDGSEVGVVRVGDGFYAMRNACPHQGAPICLGALGGTNLPSRPGDFVYGLDGKVLRCPWHSWEFDVTTGTAVGGITTKRVTTYPVEIEGGSVYVLLGRAAASI